MSSAGRLRPVPLARSLGLAAAGLALAALPIAVATGNSYWLDVLTYTYLFAGLAAAWNIIGGFGGQFSLGHGLFFALGAYTVARLHLAVGLSAWLALPVAAVLGVLLSVAVSWPTFRLKGPFFAIATMAVNEVGLVAANHMEFLTGGPQGLLVPFRPSFSALIFAERWKSALLMFGFMAAVVVVSLIVRREKLGHYLLALRANEDAARAAGVGVLRVKLLGMGISAALTAVGGGLFAMYIRVLDPPALFSLPEVGVKFALIALIGGIGTVFGPVLGAFAIVPAETLLRGALSAQVPGGHLIVLGLILILAARFFRRGIVGTVEAAWRSRREAA